MKIAFLVTTIPGFFAACIEALASSPGVEVLLLRVAPDSRAPFALDEVTPTSAEVKTWPELPSAEEALEAIEEFDPDVIMVSGWQLTPYRRVARAVADRCLRVVLLDNQWLGTPKQWLGVLTSRFYLHPFFDVAFLPGRNQEVFAKKLGFAEDRIWWGAYSCDLPLFLRAHPEAVRKRSFLCVGRLVPEKGIDVLARAYAQYRSTCEDPWELEIFGSGPLAEAVTGAEGVTSNGFAQPSDLPLAYASAGCFVMPSVFEPWGAVIHEAAAAGLPIICTTACGAAPHLVEDATNGYLVEPGNAHMLARAMRRISNLDAAELGHMGAMSSLLAERYSPELWAHAFIQRSAEALDNRRSGESGQKHY
jgi:glycosyltransferase involved in cell wall biosynthesis